MGGRGEMDGNNRYDVADVNRCLFFWADPSTANAYERFAGDANVDGSSFNVADVMQIVYQALGLGPCN